MKRPTVSARPIQCTCADCGDTFFVSSLDDRRLPCPWLDKPETNSVHSLDVMETEENRSEQLVTATELDIEQLSDDATGGGTAVQRLVFITTEHQTFRDGRQSDQPMLHIAWEPLSFEQRFDRTVYPFRTDDYSHDWLTVFSRDGRPMGGKMPIGRVKDAFNELGFKLNPAGMKELAGKTFVTQRVFDEYTKKGADGNPMVDDAGNEVKQRNWFTVPTEVLDNYQISADRKVISYPRGNGSRSGTTKATISEAQITALKAALNGKSESDYFDAVVGTPEINCDPFVGELVEPARLTERLVALGGEVIKGKVYFA